MASHGDLIKKFEAGYVAGVKSVDPAIKVDVKYLTEDPFDGKTGFENPAGGKTAAEGQLDKGADIIYHAAGKSGLGVFQAASEPRARASGRSVSTPTSTRRPRRTSRRTS